MVAGEGIAAASLAVLVMASQWRGMISGLTVLREVGSSLDRRHS
jgi:hypothetical protein